jgi:flagellar protein FliO/FliZ
VIDLWDSLLRTASALTIVLGLMGVLAWAARRLLSGRMGMAGAGPLVQVVASGYVGPRKTISIVSVAGDYLIVGTTATDLVHLGRVQDPARVTALLADAPSSPAAPADGGFTLAAWLRRATSAARDKKDLHADE